jgi:hypothetical protein
VRTAPVRAAAPLRAATRPAPRAKRAPPPVRVATRTTRSACSVVSSESRPSSPGAHFQRSMLSAVPGA